MKVAVLSGKGGTGKTFIAVNLAVSAPESIYIDCDVEEPNGRLFFKSDCIRETDAITLLPEFDAFKCNGCKACVDFCEFNALFYIKEKPKVFSEVCHACGGCMMVCPTGAVTEIKKRVGIVEESNYKSVRIITGIMDIGEASGIPVIRQALKMGKEGVFQVIDCPPGSSCAVMESIKDADYCILVTEATAFGLHNLKLVYELTKIFNKRCGIVINKEEAEYLPLMDFCKDNEIEVLLRLPFSMKIAKSVADGEIVSESDDDVGRLFKELYCRVGGASDI